MSLNTCTRVVVSLFPSSVLCYTKRAVTQKSLVRCNFAMTLSFDFEGQGHIFSPAMTLSFTLFARYFFYKLCHLGLHGK